MTASPVGISAGPRPGQERCTPGGYVLLLGWKAPLGEAVITRGLRPVVLYGPAERSWAEPIPEPDCLPVYCHDPSRLEASLPALLRSGVALGELTAVCPAGEAYVIAASEYASLLRLPGLPLRTSIACRDKAVQKSLVNGPACRAPTSG